MDNRAIEQEKAVNSYNGDKGTILASMRLGKTKIAINIQQKLNFKKILWITPSVKLRDIDIPNEFIKWKEMLLLQKNTIICYRSLAKISLKELRKYDLIVCDELQYLSKANSKNLLHYHGNLLGLTATYPTGYFKKKLLEKLGLDNITYKLSVDEAADKKIVSDYNIAVCYFELNNTNKTYKSKKGKLYTEKEWSNVLNYIIDKNEEQGKSNMWPVISRTKFLYNCESRKKAWKKLRNKFKDKRGLIFYPYKKDAETEDYYFHSSSGDKYYKDFQNGKANILGLVKSGSVGHTYKGIEFIIVCQINSDKTGQITQMFGRGIMPGEDLNCYYLCAKGTQDEVWLEKALKRFDKNKIKKINL